VLRALAALPSTLARIESHLSALDADVARIEASVESDRVTSAAVRRRVVAALTDAAGRGVMACVPHLCSSACADAYANSQQVAESLTFGRGESSEQCGKCYGVRGSLRARAGLGCVTFDALASVLEALTGEGDL